MIEPYTQRQARRYRLRPRPVIPPPPSTCPTNAVVPTLHLSTPPLDICKFTRKSRVDRTIESNARTSGSEERKEASRLGKEDQEGTSYRYTSIPVELVDFSQTRHTHIPSTIERSYLYSRSSYSEEGAFDFGVVINYHLNTTTTTTAHDQPLNQLNGNRARL